MNRILITGMSGVGKSTAIQILQARGFRAIDTDSDDWSEWVSEENGHSDWIWREDEIRRLLEQTPDRPLFISGCKSNQGKFYPLFDHVVLLTAPPKTILERIDERSTNPYGKSPEERKQILEYIQTVEPLLRKTSDVEIDTSRFTPDQVVDQLLELARSVKPPRLPA